MAPSCWGLHQGVYAVGRCPAQKPGDSTVRFGPIPCAWIPSTSQACSIALQAADAVHCDPAPPVMLYMPSQASRGWSEHVTFSLAAQSPYFDKGNVGPDLVKWGAMKRFSRKLMGSPPIDEGAVHSYAMFPGRGSQFGGKKGFFMFFHLRKKKACFFRLRREVVRSVSSGPKCLSGTYKHCPNPDSRGSKAPELFGGGGGGPGIPKRVQHYPFLVAHFMKGARYNPLNEPKKG